MLINLPEIIKKYNLNIKGVIQVGCHWCEEHEIFVGLGIKDIVYIEPCTEAFSIITKKIFGNNDDCKSLEYGLDETWGNSSNNYGGKDGKYKKAYMGEVGDSGIHCYNYACGEDEGEFTMYVSNDNQGQSNSLLKPNLHLQQHPEVVFSDYEIVKVIQLDNVPFKKENYNLLVMDCQGSEGLVLKGATETLKHIDCIYTEINTDQTYEGNMLVGEMDEYLSEFGFVRVETFMPSPNWSWGDAIFCKNKGISAGDYKWKYK